MCILCVVLCVYVVISVTGADRYISALSHASYGGHARSNRERRCYDNLKPAPVSDSTFW